MSSTKRFWQSRTFWLNISALPITALLVPWLGNELAMKISLTVTTVANLVLRLFYTDEAVTL